MAKKDKEDKGDKGDKRMTSLLFPQKRQERQGRVSVS